MRRTVDVDLPSASATSFVVISSCLIDPVAEGMGASETRGKLSAEGAALRARLQAAPAVREKDPLAKTLSELLSMPEEKAGKLQHGALAVIFELVCAGLRSYRPAIRTSPRFCTL